MAARKPRSACAETAAVVGSLRLTLLVKKVVGCIRNKCQMADIGRRGPGGRRRAPSRGVQPLDEGRRAQCVATGRSLFGPCYPKQEPGNGTHRNEFGVGRGLAWPHLAPYRARIPGVLPRGANR